MSLGKKIRIYYDPRGQAIKTLNPDDSFQTVFFGNVTDLAQPENYEPSPWVSFTYDANDNGDRRPGGRGLTPLSHINTPKSAEMDALGRTIKTTEHKVQYEIISAPGVIPVVWGWTDVVIQYEYDIRGNLKEVTDPNGRTAFLHKYDYANRGLWTDHIDSGASLVNMDVMGKPVEATDTKGAKVLNSYDVLNRPIRLWAKDNSAALAFTLRQYLIYGDDLTATGYNDTQTKDYNLYGKGWKAFDEAGMVHTEPYDFKSNLLEKNRQVIKDSELLSVFSGPPVNWQVSPYIVDWTGLSTAILDAQVFTTTMEYDALNRAMKVTYPGDVNGNRKELTPTYNRAGTLHKVHFDGDEYIKEIAYNAKGQPLLTAYGNGIMTRLVYDENTFRTVRLKSEKYTYNQAGSTHTYAYNSGTTRQDFAYEYDLIGNIMKLHDRTPDCGTTPVPNELDRLFDYDPLYRVIAASGRESTNQSPSILWGDAPAVGSPNANSCRLYTQAFGYDKLGNMKELNHTATSNSYTRNYVYANYASDNKLSEINNGGSPATVYSTFNYDANGNMNQSSADRKYIWDAADQLKAFSIQAGTSEPSVYAQYLYSGGSRVKKIVRTAGGDYEITVYDGAFEYCKKVIGLTTYEKNYSHVESGVEIRTGDIFPGDISDDILYQLGDNIGSCNLRLTVSGTIIDKEEYYPFGDTSLRTFTYKRYRYVGKEKDAESGLYYYGARYYASWTCRFISVDPLATEYAHLTPYNYAGNKPINSIDVDGLQSNSPVETKSQKTQPIINDKYTVQPVDNAQISGVSILPQAPTSLPQAAKQPPTMPPPVPLPSVFTNIDPYPQTRKEGEYLKNMPESEWKMRVKPQLDKAKAQAKEKEGKEEESKARVAAEANKILESKNLIAENDMQIPKPQTPATNATQSGTSNLQNTPRITAKGEFGVEASAYGMTTELSTNGARVTMENVDITDNGIELKTGVFGFGFENKTETQRYMSPLTLPDGRVSWYPKEIKTVNRGFNVQVFGITLGGSVNDVYVNNLKIQHQVFSTLGYELKAKANLMGVKFEAGGEVQMQQLRVNQNLMNR